MTNPIAVLGAGSWGTAIAIHLASTGRSVRLWGRDHNALQSMQQLRENTRYLPGCTFPESLVAEPDLQQACVDCHDICLVVPTHAFQSVVSQLQAVAQPKRIVWGTKGLASEGDAIFLHQQLRASGVSSELGVIGGPTFARELACGLPTALVIASDSPGLLADFTDYFHAERVRCYTSEDLVGVQLCGVLKNIFAVAAGISDGLGLGANARSALITRGLAEMLRLAEFLGASSTTCMGLSGVGDLVLSCTSDQSRNRRLGLAIGKAASVEKACQQIDQVVESVSNVDRVYQVVKSQGVSTPIIDQVYAVLTNQMHPKEALSALIARRPTRE